jgi:hypothetical protein
MPRFAPFLLLGGLLVAQPSAPVPSGTFATCYILASGGADHSADPDPSQYGLHGYVQWQDGTGQIIKCASTSLQSGDITPATPATLTTSQVSCEAIVYPPSSTAHSSASHAFLDAQDGLDFRLHLLRDQAGHDLSFVEVERIP